jgi:biotin-(acetyl-CoA carboxylase) ligase
MLLISILDHFKDEYAHFEKGDYKTILAYSRSISNTIGKYVRVSFLGKDVVGKVRDINDHGALVLEHDDTTHVVYAGDVDFLRPLG